MFIAPMNTPGIKLICRPPTSSPPPRPGSPLDYPLTSRFDENDAIFVFDNVFIPWENVLFYRDMEKLKIFYPQSGFFNGFSSKAARGSRSNSTFMVGVIAKAPRAAGVRRFRGVQAQIGEVIGWRHLFWCSTDAMAANPSHG